MTKNTNNLKAAAPELLKALEQAALHLEYCNYGDKWERECAVAAKLKEQIDGALAKAKGKTV